MFDSAAVALSCTRTPLPSVSNHTHINIKLNRYRKYGIDPFRIESCFLILNHIQNRNQVSQGQMTSSTSNEPIFAPNLALTASDIDTFCVQDYFQGLGNCKNDKLRFGQKLIGRLSEGNRPQMFARLLGCPVLTHWCGPSCVIPR